MKTLLLIITVVLAWGINVFSQTAKGNEIAPEVPKSATVEIILSDAPGINDEGSRWEINYEFRIASDAAIWDAHKRMDGSEGRVGDLIKEGSFNQMLRSPANRRMILTIPLPTEIQARLRNQPTPSEAANTKVTTEQSRELETRGQNLSFHSVIEIHDAKLKKNIVVPVSRSWSFIGLTDARFEIKIQLNAEGGYRWDSSDPKHGPGMEIIKKHE